MQYLLLPLIDEDSWRNQTQAEQEQGMAAFVDYVQALAQAGVLVGNYRPYPSASAKTVHTHQGQMQVTDGPYAHTQAQMGGLYIIDVPDLAAALAWAARSPAAGYGAVEVRPLWGAPA